MSVPIVRDLEHLRQILQVELERAKREGWGTLYLDGCTTPDACRVVEEQARDVAADDPTGCLLALAPTSGGFAVTFARNAAPALDPRALDPPTDDYVISQSAF